MTQARTKAAPARMETVVTRDWRLAVGRRTTEGKRRIKNKTKVSGTEILPTVGHHALRQKIQEDIFLGGGVRIWG